MSTPLRLGRDHRRAWRAGWVVTRARIDVRIDVSAPLHDIGTAEREHHLLRDVMDHHDCARIRSLRW